MLPMHKPFSLPHLHSESSSRTAPKCFYFCFFFPLPLDRGSVLDCSLPSSLALGLPSHGRTPSTGNTEEATSEISRKVWYGGRGNGSSQPSAPLFPTQVSTNVLLHSPSHALVLPLAPGTTSTISFEMGTSCHLTAGQ